MCVYLKWHKCVPNLEMASLHVCSLKIHCIWLYGACTIILLHVKPEVNCI